MLFTTKKSHRYNGGKRVEGTRRRQNYEFGDEFEVHRNDVALVKALGWGVPADEAKPARTAAVRRQAPPKKVVAASASTEVAAEVVQPPAEPAAPPAEPPADIPASTPTPAPAVAPRTSTYIRRDLTAEGT